MKQITKSEFKKLEAKVTKDVVDKISANVSRSAVFAVMLTVFEAFEMLATEMFDTDESIEIITNNEQ